MKNLLVLYAQYNIATNNKICKILQQMPADELSAERKSYYGSIFGLANHLLAGTWNYLNAVHHLTGGVLCPDIEEIESSGKTVQEIIKYLTASDQLLLKVATEIPSEGLHLKKQKLRIYNGRAIDIQVWQYFLQHITHQVHHQGQMSQIFDELNIEHEFGNIFPLIPDSQ